MSATFVLLAAEGQRWPARVKPQIDADASSRDTPGLGPLPPFVCGFVGQHTELVAIGIGHDHPADLALADVDASRPEGDEPVDLLVLVTVDGWSEVEMQPVLPGLRHQRRTAP